MNARFLLAAALLSAPALGQTDNPAAPSPGEIVATAPANAWVDIAPDDLLVMDLAPGAWEQPGRVVIQLMAPPFSQPWVANIRTLAKAHWWDSLAIVRAQDNYVVQWGDPDAEDAGKARPLPATMAATSEDEYARTGAGFLERNGGAGGAALRDILVPRNDVSQFQTFHGGFPVMAHATPDSVSAWPVHCYGTVGVGRGMSPDAGSGAELYTVIGHAPRHLDRNIAVVGRVIEGVEHLSTLPRGTEALGFYKTPQERTPITSIRLGSEVAGLPGYQYLSTESQTFARYADARANRRDPFFIVPAGGADLCNIPVPTRRAPGRD